MFLAWREIKHQPLRFGLIAAVIALMAYVTFFLSGLSHGLAFKFRAAAENLNAQTIVMTQESNNNSSASRLTPAQVKTAHEALGDKGAVVSMTPAVVSHDGARENVYLFGLEQPTFAAPQVEQGRAVADAAHEVVVDSSLAAAGYRVGDPLMIIGSTQSWTIVGMTSGSTFITAPVVYLDRAALQASADTRLPVTPNIIAVQGELTDQQRASLSTAGLVSLSLDDFISTLSGYKAQVLTFTMMIAALIGISAIVLAIFIYVLTLQKRPVLGVLKARGVPTKHLIIAGSVQTAMLSAAGVAVGLALTIASSFVLPAKLPFMLDIPLVAVITVSFIVCAVLGGLVSVRTVASIDPVEAIA